MITPSKAADKIVAELDRRNIGVYVSLAKYGLWITSAVLLVIIASGSVVFMIDGFSSGVAGVVVQACQVAAMISITVLGFHGYEGSRIFHILRHLGDGKD